MLDLSPYDASGISIHKSGGWVERLHGKKKRYIKIQFDVKTKEVYGDNYR